uniref:Uncharacterized protein n=1 Tax=Rhizophora mucronata TaxID=61149 RepID=A0A2P2P160_RHIMU
MIDGLSRSSEVD